MKKYIHILCVLLAAAFASCSQSELGDETPQSKQTILKVVASDGLQTRATAAGVDRFAIEVYTDATYTTPANVFGSGDAATNKANNATGEFAMILDRTQAYYCLLWADKSGSTAYNIDNLKAIALTGKAVEAWHGTKEIAAGTDAALTATLNRAVSKISLMETGKLKAGTLTLNLNQPTAFNVATATTTGNATARPEESITIAAAGVDGSTAPTTGVKLNTTDIFVLSSVATANLTDLTFKYGTEDAFTVPQAPLKANYNTNIKGHYSTAKSGTTFTVTCNGAWGTPDNEPASSLKVGDYYPAGATKDNAVGVVFWIDPNDAAKGKIVSMNESGVVNWSDAKTWAESVTEGSLSWALPTKDELQYIWCAYNGASPVTWEKSANPPCPAKDEDKWGVFNDKLTSPFQKKFYWSSTEAEPLDGKNTRWGATFTIGNTYGGVETMESGRYARAVASFGTAPEPPATAYAVGDLYPNATDAVGIVFVVSNDGTSGKVLSFEEATNTAWGVEGLVNASDAEDGATNMAAIQAISGWETSYPAFKWCAGRPAVNGNRWYLPAQGELQAIKPNIEALNAVILNLGKTKIDGYWWTSTEFASNAASKAVYVQPSNARVLNEVKTTSTVFLRVRAVLAF